MDSLSQFFSFRSFRTRLIVFLLGLLVPVLGGIFYYVNSNNTEYTEQTINRNLQVGADVFDYTREQQARTLDAITKSLTWDFGFRSAYASGDPGTLFDAALNVLTRSEKNVDMLMIVDLDYRVIIDTETQGFDELENSWAALLDEADQDVDGSADMIVMIEDSPFQLIALPLFLPTQVAWTIGGFALDTDFVDQVKETTVSEISVIRVRENGAVDVIVSTLSEPRRQLLARQIDVRESDTGRLQRIAFEEEEFTTLLRRLYGQEGDPLQVLAVIQRSYDENNANVLQFRQLLFRFYAAIIFLSLLFVVLLARSITKPLLKLVHVVKRIEEGDYQRSVQVTSRDELGELAVSVNSMAGGLAEKEKVRDLLGKVVSHQIAEQLLNNPVELGGEERIATILFSDIRGFTSYCEDLAPRRVLEELNKVLSRISDIVEAHDGVVDKFQGDAVMALFGAPVQSDRDAANALAATLEIIAALAATDTVLTACVGVTTGVVVAGNLGSANRLNYSVIGDTVNLAARLESLTRLYHVSNIVSEATAIAAPEFIYRELDSVRVAGKTRSVKIYQLIAHEDAVTAAQQDELHAFDAALNYYRAQDWGVAETAFSDLQLKCNNSALYQVFLERIVLFRDNPPAQDWQGVFSFGKK